MKILRLAIVFGALHTCMPLRATTIVPFAHLGEAAQQSAAVVMAIAMNAEETLDGDMSYNEMRFQVTYFVKGPMDMGQEFMVRPHCRYNQEVTIDVSGDFEPVAGKSYLMFLMPNGTIWRPQMMSYYVFEELDYNGQALLAPMSGAGIEVAPRPDGVIPEPLQIYDRDELLEALLEYVSDMSVDWNPDILQGQYPPDFLLTERALPAYCDFMLGSSVTLARWQNPAANVYFDDTGAPAGFSATLTSILATMRAGYPGITPTNAGQTSFTPDCVGGSVGTSTNFLTYSNTNLSGAQSILIVFEDPCNEITNLTGCSGVLGMGGSYTIGGTHIYREDVWRNGAYGYLIVNNGVPACYSGTSLSRFLTHELSHAYRMDHISTTAPGAPGQNMNPSCCNPINTLDMDCMNYVYSTNLPVELISFTAERKNERQALLNWKTATEQDNAYFTLERSADGIHFKTIAQIEAANERTGGNYEYLDAQVNPGMNYYRLSQTDLSGRSANLGIRSLRFDEPVSLQITPSPVARENNGAVAINCAAFFEGTLDIIASDGRVVYSQTLSLEAGQHRIELTQALAAGVYRAVLYDGQQVLSAGFSQL